LPFRSTPGVPFVPTRKTEEDVRVSLPINPRSSFVPTAVSSDVTCGGKVIFRSTPGVPSSTTEHIMSSSALLGPSDQPPEFLRSHPAGPRDADRGGASLPINPRSSFVPTLAPVLQCAAAPFRSRSSCDRRITGHFRSTPGVPFVPTNDYRSALTQPALPITPGPHHPLGPCEEAAHLPINPLRSHDGRYAGRHPRHSFRSTPGVPFVPTRLRERVETRVLPINPRSSLPTGRKWASTCSSFRSTLVPTVHLGPPGVPTLEGHERRAPSLPINPRSSFVPTPDRATVRQT